MDTNMAYLFAAYSIIWLGLFVFIFLLLQREKKLRREIQSLREELQEKSVSPADR
jgi:CcmD family protein